MSLGVSSSRPSSSAVRTSPSANTHTVQRGDTMTHIAKANGLSLDDLVRANPQIRDPNKIYPGQELNLPERRVASAGTPDAAPVEAPRRNTLSTGAGVRPPPGGLALDTHRARFDSNLTLRRGSNGPEVEALQQKLKDLGHDPGAIDGAFGPQTHRALQDFQRSQNLSPDGVLGPRTRTALQNPEQPQPVATTPGSAPRLQVYEPGSPEQRALFRDAARLAGVPESWADSPGLANILRRESGGRVGVPNYTYGDRARDPSRWGEIHDELKNGRITARSSATGLGQLLLSNVDRYYPAGRAGIGDPVQEAAGMLAYIKDRYGNPENAWAQYGRNHEGY